MAAPGPNLDAGPLRLGQLREEARKRLVDALDQRRGKKVLVLDPKVSGYLGIIAEVALLKEHGVEQLFHLGAEPLGDLDVRHVIYLVRSRNDIAQQVARQIKSSHSVTSGSTHEFTVLLLPRKSIVCEKIFQEEGVFGDVTLGEFPLDVIPFEEDVVSLEYDSALQEVLVEGDRSSLYATARALTKIQQLTGSATYIAGKGNAAAAVRDMVLRMRGEMGAAAPPVGDSAVDLILLLDREVDVVTPLCTQLTYEGLVDEVVGIHNGFVHLELAGQRQKIPLNSSDRVFRELRDKSFAAVGPWLSERAKGLQNDYIDTRSTDKSLAELKEFAQQLKSLPQISRHINLAEHVNKAAADSLFRTRVRAEQEIIDGNAADTTFDTIQELMEQGVPCALVVRLLCLLSITHNGVPKRHYDAVRQQLLQTYGHEHILTLSALSHAGLLRRSDGSKSTFSSLKKSLRLLVPEVNERNPDDVSYTYAGYAPISIRLVEGLLQGGWNSLEESLRLLPGPQFALKQTLDDNGMPAVKVMGSGRIPRNPGGERQVVLVVFIGGVTFSEISALRFLSSQSSYPYQFVVLSSKVVNGSSLIESFVEDIVRNALERSALD